MELALPIYNAHPYFPQKFGQKSMPGKNGSLNHPTQGDSRNPMSVFCQPHPRTDEIKGLNLILVHQHTADEHSLENLS